MSMEDEYLPEMSYALEDAAREGDLDTVKFFIKRGVTVDYDAINEAIAAGQLDVVKYLIGELGVRPDDALYTAMIYGNIPITDYLISVGYYPEAREIMGAISGDNLPLLKYLRMKGIKVDDREGPVLPWALLKYPDMSPVMAKVLVDILTITDIPFATNSEASQYILSLTEEPTPGTGDTDMKRLINFYY
jgi:hypothetical protein